MSGSSREFAHVAQVRRGRMSFSTSSLQTTTSPDPASFGCKICARSHTLKRAHLIFVSGVVVWLGMAATSGLAQRPAAAPAAPAPRAAAPQRPAPTAAAAAAAAPDLNAVVKRYCVTCHTDARKPGGLSLASFDIAHAADHAEVTEAMIRKLQAGMMPPPLSARPDAAIYAKLISTLETSVDSAAATKPNPGVRTFQRLNRPEYARAIDDLLALDVDAGNWLPLDTK